MLTKIVRHAGIVAMHCVGITVGLVAGICLATAKFGSEAAGLLGAFLGAAIAVLGAFWASEHRDRVESENLRRILTAGVQKLLDAANAGAESTEGLTASVARERARVVINRWRHVEAFSPYRELDDFDLISKMADIDACCRSLLPHTEEPEITSRTGGDAMAQIQISRRYGSNMQAVVSGCEEAARRCKEALRGLVKR